MALLPLAYAELLAGGFLVTMGLSGCSPAEVMQGEATEVTNWKSWIPDESKMEVKTEVKGGESKSELKEKIDKSEQGELEEYEKTGKVKLRNYEQSRKK